MGTTDRAKAYANIVKQATVAGRARDDEGREVIHTLHPAAMPKPSGITAEVDDASYLMPKKPASELNVRPYTGPGRGRHSAAPNFKLHQLIDAPVLNPQTREITMGKKFQFYVDPEEYIARTMNYPGANEMTGTVQEPGEIPVSERAVAQYHGMPTPAYGGSTDARLESTGAHRATGAVWQRKEEDVTSPPGALREVTDHSGKKEIRPVRSAGLFARLMRGEKILNPAHHIIDPDPPKYGPRLLTNTEIDPDTGQPTNMSWDDAGGFGHDQPVQWEGHHRMKAAALKQKAQREAGVQDWGVPVPVDTHFGTDVAMSNHVFMKLSEGIVEQRSRRRAALRGMLSGTRGGGADPNNAKQPKRVLGSRMAPGTWNSKAY